MSMNLISAIDCSSNFCITHIGAFSSLNCSSIGRSFPLHSRKIHLRVGRKFTVPFSALSIGILESRVCEYLQDRDVLLRSHSDFR